MKVVLTGKNKNKNEMYFINLKKNTIFATIKHNMNITET